jgi:hypothetical protein
LDSVNDNTTDANKPVITAQQSALNLKLTEVSPSSGTSTFQSLYQQADVKYILKMMQVLMLPH